MSAKDATRCAKDATMSAKGATMSAKDATMTRSKILPKLPPNEKITPKITPKSKNYTQNYTQIKKLHPKLHTNPKITPKITPKSRRNVGKCRSAYSLPIIEPRAPKGASAILKPSHEITGHGNLRKSSGPSEGPEKIVVPVVDSSCCTYL